MSSEHVSLQIQANPREPVDFQANYRKLLEFEASFAGDERWIGQSLRSMLTEESLEPCYLATQMSFSSIAREGDRVVITGDRYEPECVFTPNLSYVPTSRFHVTHESKEIPLSHLEKYSYEANGFVRREPGSVQYPKWDLIQQAVQQHVYERLVPGGRFSPEGPIGRVLIRGEDKYITLESATLDEVPLSQRELSMRSYVERIGEYRMRLGERTDLIRQVADDPSREDSLFPMLMLMMASYTTPTGWRDRKLMALLQSERNLTILRTEAPRIGLSHVSEHVPNMSLLHLESLINDEIFHAKSQGSYVPHFNPSLIDSLLERTDEYIGQLDRRIQHYDLRNLAEQKADS